MPEGPEHFKAAQFINQWSQGRVFNGKIIKSEINTRNPDIELDGEKYTISAKSRGKELMITLYKFVDMKKKKRDTKNTTVKSECDDCLFCCSIVFQFGMSGCFQFTTIENLHKHAHLMFYTDDDEDAMVLSFVDTRRFGKWRISETFSEDRGPDPVSEYKAFRKNILENLGKSVFQKAICEVLHNQKYFNGIGNYLRAEILYRSGIPPFVSACDVLKDLKIDKEEPKRKKTKNAGTFDLLEWCTLVPFEVCMLEGSGYNSSGSESDYTRFTEWLQCYNQPDMMNLIDKDKRTIWFKDLPGPLAPKDGHSRHGQSKSQITGEKKLKKKTKTLLKRKMKAEVPETNAKAKKSKQSTKKSIKEQSVVSCKQGVKPSARLKGATTKPEQDSL